MLSYPNNFARFLEEGARPARNQQETRGGVSSLGGPALDGDGQSQADPLAPPLPPRPLGPRQPLCPETLKLRALHSRPATCPRGALQRRQEAGEGTDGTGHADGGGAGSVWGGEVPGAGGPGSWRSRGRTVPMPVPRASHPAGAHPPAPWPAPPANSTTRAEPPLLRSTYRGRAELSESPAAFLSFLPPRPSSSCRRPPGAPALALEGAAAGAGGARGARLPARSFGGGGGGGGRSLNAGRAVPGRRLEVAAGAPLALRTRPAPAPASGAPDWGEVRAGAEGGAGRGPRERAGDADAEKEAKKREAGSYSLHGMSGSWC